MDKAALYYLTLTSPWKLQENKNKRKISELIPKAGNTYEDFVVYMKELKAYNEEKNTYEASFLQRCLHSYIVDTSRNMRTKITNKVMSAKFRARTTDKWGTNKNGPPTYPTIQTVCQSINYWRHKHKCEDRKIASNSSNIEDETQNMTSNIEEDARNHMKLLQKECLEFSEKDKDAKEAIHKYLGHTLESISNTNKYNTNNYKVLSNAIIANHLATKIWETIIDKYNTEPNSIIEENAINNIPQNKIILNDSSHTFENIYKNVNATPTEDQLKAISEVNKYLKSEDQFLVFIHGGPGVGKTWTINEIKKEMNKLNKKHVSIAFTGVAASLLSGGETIHSLFHIPIGKKTEFYNNTTLNDKAVRNIHEKFFDCFCIIIDEISMVGSGMLYKINKRLQEIMNNNIPFGGKNMIVLGDFFQIIPVGDSCLYQDIIKFLIAPQKNITKKQQTNNAISLNDICTKGAHLFTKFKILNLNIQVRAAEDLEQLKTLQCLRSFNDNQVSQSFLKSLVHNNTLKSTDFQCKETNSYMSWTSAPLAVTSNAERDNLMFIGAQQWASENSVPIITWKLNCTGSVLNFIKDDKLLNEIYHPQSGLLGFFVQGAMSYLTENINPSKGLANGSTVYMHSLSFNEEDMESCEYKSFIEILNNSKPGEEIHLNSMIPSFINVEIIMTSELKKYWKSTQTVVENKYIVPIGFRSRPIKTTIDCKIQNEIYNNVHILKNKVHRVELSFVVTLHKLQGKTMPKLILELNQRPFAPSITYNAFLVALSRVKKRSDLRILPIQSGKDILYLQKLKPDINLKIWLTGFDKDGNWNKRLCTEYFKHMNEIKLHNDTINKKKKPKKIKLQYTNKSTVENTILSNIIPKTLPTMEKIETEMPQNTINLCEIIIHTKVNSLNNNILDLTNAPYYDNIPAEFFNSQWRQIYTEYMQNNANLPIINKNETNVWQITNAEKNITEQYYLLAQNMLENNLTHDNMPNYMEKYCHFSGDVLSLKRHNWLTGTIIDTFLLTIDVDINTGEQKNVMNILRTGFYASLSNTLDDNEQRTDYNTYNYEAITRYVDHYTDGDFLKCTIIPIHIRDHWLLCIINPSQKTMYFIDSLRKNNLIVKNYIITWYQTELEKHHYNMLHHNITTWTIIDSSNLPSSVPKQTDGSSCGIFLAMTAYYWYHYNILPDKNVHWNENNINSLTPNLRHFILHEIIHTIYLENKRLLDTVL